MIDEVAIDLFTRAATRGSARGADRVWRDAQSGAARRASIPRRARARRPRGRTLAVACVLSVLAGLVVLRTSSRTDTVPFPVSFRGTIAVPVDLPAGWKVEALSNATPRPAEPANIRVYGASDGRVLVASDLVPGEASLVWTVPEGPQTSSVSVSDMTGTYADGSGNVQRLASVSVKRADGATGRVVGRGLDEATLVAAAEQLLRPDAPAPQQLLGLELRYSGVEASGPLMHGGEPQSVVLSPEGHVLTVASSPGGYDPDATSWYSPGPRTVDVKGSPAVILSLDDELMLFLAVGDRTVEIAGMGATDAELRAVAERISLAEPGDALRRYARSRDIPFSGETSVTTSTTGG